MTIPAEIKKIIEDNPVHLPITKPKKGKGKKGKKNKNKSNKIPLTPEEVRTLEIKKERELHEKKIKEKELSAIKEAEKEWKEEIKGYSQLASGRCKIVDIQPHKWNFILKHRRETGNEKLKGRTVVRNILEDKLADILALGVTLLKLDLKNSGTFEFFTIMFLKK